MAGRSYEQWKVGDHIVHDLRRTAEEIHRSNSRVSVARLELDRLKREEERTHEARARNLAMAEQKEAERAERELRAWYAARA